MSNHYETLNVTRDAEAIVIESAYRALMKRYHPDKTNGDPIAAERAKQINAAYSTLRDAETRARYDRSLGEDAQPFRSASQTRAAPEPSVADDAVVPIRSSTLSGVISLVFVGLAVLIGVGAVGSVMGAGSNTDTRSSGSADADTSNADSFVSPAAGTSRTQSDPEAEPKRGTRPQMRSAEDEGRSSATGKATSSPTAGDADPSQDDGIVRPTETAIEATPKDLEGLF
jgi:curved DNA-binding protein CbpA